MARKKAAEDEPEEIALHRQIKEAMRMFRELRRWNQETMANRLGTTKARYQKYEYDPPEDVDDFRKVPTIILKRFCDIADMTLKEIADGKRPTRRAV